MNNELNESTNGRAVQLEGVSKVFRDFWRRPKVKAVDEISLEIKRGEIFGLLGPNGSGKSTTIKMILGLLFPTDGNILVMGHGPRHVGARHNIGYLPEESYLYKNLTPVETLRFFARLFDLPAAETELRISELLEMFGISHAGNRLVGEFSKGMARRVGLAQALINNPALVILDEPTSGLDPIGCRQVKDLILNLARQGKTVLLSSHLLADVEDVCDRIAILYNGKIRAHGQVKQLLEQTDRIRMDLPPLTPDKTQKLLQKLRKIVGDEPEISHPSIDLEKFFLDVIEKAYASTDVASGVARQGKLAAFLEKSR